MTAPERLEGGDVLRRFAAAVVRRRLAVLIAGALATAVLTAGLTRLRVVVDPDRNLPQDHPYIAALNEMHRAFGDKNLVVIGLFPDDGAPFAPDFLGRVRRITEGLAAIPGVVRPLLQSIASPAMKDVRPTAEGISVSPIMEDAPRTAAEAAAVRDRVAANPDLRGTLVSDDGRALAIYATFELTPALPAYGDLHRAVQKVLRANDDGHFQWALSGPVVLASAVGDQAGRMALYFPLALFVIGLVHYDAFRTAQAIFLPLLTALLAVVWAMGLMGWLGVPLDPFNTTTPILILAVAAGHAVQILKRYYEEFSRTGDAEGAVVESVVRVGGVMLAAGTIAALSFLSLAGFGIETIRVFGVFTALGILATLAIELTIVPAMRAALPRPGTLEVLRERATHPWLDRGLEGIADLVEGAGAGRVALGALLLVLGCALAARRVEVDTSFKREFRPGSSVRSEDDLLNQRFAGTSTLVFLVDAPVEGGIAEPTALAAIDRFERRIGEAPGVGKALSVVGRLKILHHAFHPDRPPDELPSTKALAAQYLFLYTLSGGDDLDTIVTGDRRTAKVVLLLHDDSTRYGQDVIARARAILDEELPPGFHYRVSGTLASNGALTEAMVRGKLANILQIAVITVTIASLVLRSLVAGLLVAIPLAVAVAIVFAAMGLLGIPLDIVTSAVAAMSVGIGADYAVYFLFRLREEIGSGAPFGEALRTTLRTSGKAIVFVATAIAAGYSTLCLSGFAFHVHLGGLVALAMLASATATLLLLPAATSLLSRGRFGDLLRPPGKRLDRGGSQA
ncbi:MAG: MMPL family transporter [Deltaproteobacteria bacterium]